MASCVIIPLGQRHVKAPLWFVTVSAARFQLGHAVGVSIAQREPGLPVSVSCTCVEFICSFTLFLRRSAEKVTGKVEEFTAERNADFELLDAPV